MLNDADADKAMRVLQASIAGFCYAAQPQAVAGLSRLLTACLLEGLVYGTQFYTLPVFR